MFVKDIILNKISSKIMFNKTINSLLKSEFSPPLMYREHSSVTPDPDRVTPLTGSVVEQSMSRVRSFTSALREPGQVCGSGDPDS